MALWIPILVYARIVKHPADLACGGFIVTAEHWYPHDVNIEVRLGIGLYDGLEHPTGAMYAAASRRRQNRQDTRLIDGGVESFLQGRERVC